MGTVLRCLCRAAFAVVAAAVASSFCHAADAPLVLENQRVLLEMDPACGTICRMLDKSSGIELAPARDLAENFRLLVLLPHKKKATILGKDQKLSGVKRTADGLRLSWNGPLRDTAGVGYQINVRMEVKAAGSELQFGLHLDNGTAGKVENVWYPMIGGLAKFGVPGKPADGVLWIPTSVPTTKKMELPFGWTALAYPGQMNLSFTCVESAHARKSLSGRYAPNFSQSVALTS